ncbi:MAG: hypothetical protein RL172_395 [Bacteroidota bacterium]|jgi:hypothetical protein
MNKILLLLCLLVVTRLAYAQQNAALLRHVVLFSFKEGSTPQQIKTVTDAFAQLPKKITTIKAFEWGTNSSPENLAQGFTHCFFVSFASEKDRDAYLPHPEHTAFVNVIRPILDKVLVIDYWQQ